VPPENLEKIHAGLTHASDRTKLYVTGSGHVVTRDAVRDQVFKSAGDFIRKVESQLEP
jgi:esterase/lipase